MKISLCFGGSVPKYILLTIKNFISYLQSEIPLNDNVKIVFLENREVNMTTGVRRKGSEIFILYGGRLLIDVLRTLCHEWVHEYQYQKMGLLRDNNIQQRS